MIKIKRKAVATFAIMLLWGGIAVAQESVNASGGNATGGGGSASYSIGQTISTTNIGNNGSSAQGVQHAYEIFSVGLNETSLNISLNVFPNPTADNLTIQISDYIDEVLSYQLFDSQSRMISSGQIISNQTQIDMNNLPTATYYVIVLNQEIKKVQSFKIIKSN